VAVPAPTILQQANDSLLQQLTPVLAAVASGVSALAGVWVGKRLESHTQTQADQMRRSVELYTRFLLKCHDFTASVFFLFADVDDSEMVRLHASLRESVVTLQEAASEIELFAPDNIVSAATAVADDSVLIADALSSAEGIAVASADVPEDDVNRWPPVIHLNDHLQLFKQSVRIYLRSIT